jgi:hypothetical protein
MSLPRAARRLVLLVALMTGPAACAADGRGAWPLVPLHRPAVPGIRDRTWVRNPIDAFVLARLEAAGLGPAPQADRLTLLRRVTFDLTGLAPTPEEVAAFVADDRPGAYERVVDRLLASPHFGERWAQHWLDLVRYADTDGFKQDRVRPTAYRYRDWVIRAFNDDLPYDRFVTRQLAGDELEPDEPDALVATGLYRLPPEEESASDYTRMRQDLLDDVTDVFGLAFLGLTVGCARCHDHKFDPLTQTGYYRLQAFFAGLVHRDVPLADAAARAEHARRQAAWEEATGAVRAEIDHLLQTPRRQVFEEVAATFDPQTRDALRVPEEARTPLQRQLAVLAGRQLSHRYARLARRLSGAGRARYEDLKRQLAAFDGLRPPPLPAAAAVTDAGPDAPPTYRLAGGNHLRPREEVFPDFPTCLGHAHHCIEPPAGGAGTGRRAALARWLCRPEHPLTARVIANRLWQHHLGHGIVGTPSDFGVVGEPATHPELLDWLAAELVWRGWSLKALHRLIVTSATYRQSSDPRRNPAADRAAAVDPDDKLLWRARVRRRDAESIRDVALEVSGQLSGCLYGPAAHPELPALMMDSRYAWDPDGRAADRNRRSVYVLARRNLPYPLFAAFDVPDRHTSCPARATTVTAPQALAMLNGELTLGCARRLAGRLLATHGPDTRALVRAGYRAAFGRDPAPDERAAAEQFIDRQAHLAPAPAGAPVPRDAAVVDFCHALLNAAEFLYVD